MESAMIRFESIEEEAKWLAQENKETNPDIQQVFWFPDKERKEIRLVEITELATYTIDEKEVYPFFFGPFSDDQVCIKHLMAIALIHPSSFKKKIELPENWGKWDNAKEL